MKTKGNRFAAVALAMLFMLVLFPVTAGAAIATVTNEAEFIAAVVASNDIELGADFTMADYPIPNTYTGTLDLNGQTLTLTGALTNNGTLTIKDSSASGTGKILNSGADNSTTLINNGALTIQSGTVLVAGNKTTALLNKGTLTIEGGTLERIGGSGYVVDNGGGAPNATAIMEIMGGTFKSSDGGSSLLRNYGTAVISGGSFDSPFIAIKNEELSNITINDGTVIDSVKVAFQNWGTAIINGGTFTSGRTALYVAAGSWQVSGAVQNYSSSLIVNGGIFNGTYSVAIDFNEDWGTIGVNNTIGVTINGGSFTGDIYVSEPNTMIATNTIFPSPLSNSALAVTKPVAGAIPQTTISGSGYTGTISWSPADPTFVLGTVYTATITLVPAVNSPLLFVNLGDNFFTVPSATTTTYDYKTSIIVANPAAKIPPSYVVGRVIEAAFPAATAAPRSSGSGYVPPNPTTPTTPTNNVPYAEVTGIGTGDTRAKINVYEKSTLKGKVLLKLAKGDEFNILSVYGKYAFVEANDIKGYVALSKINGLFTAYPQAVTAKKCSTYEEAKAKSSLRVSKNLPKGVDLEVLEWNGSWVRVAYTYEGEEFEAWIQASNIKFVVD